jgi:hypothetical protein
MKRKAVAVLASLALSVGGMFVLTSTHGARAALPAPPFTQCPHVGLSTGCSVLLVVNPDGSVTVLRDDTQKPYEGDDDITVGVLNNSSGAIGDVKITQNGGSVPIFGFEGDGICDQSAWGSGQPPAGAAQPAGCPFGPTGYEGPNTSFSHINPGGTSGQVDFPNGVNAGASTYFSLEGNPQQFAGSPGSPGSPGNPGRTNYNGYSTGTDVFVDALKNLAPAMELANVDVGWGASATNANGLQTQYVPAGVVPVNPAQGVTTASPALVGPFQNEMDNSVVPGQLKLPAGASTTPFNSYSRGSGIELGLGTTLPNGPKGDNNQLILAGMAEQAAAPPTPDCHSPLVTGQNPPGSCGPNDSIRTSIDVPADPLLFAGLLTGEARSAWSACPTQPTDPGAVAGTGAGATNSAKDLAFGNGQAAQVELLNTSMAPGAPKLGNQNSQPLVSVEGQNADGTTNRAASSALTFTHLDPQPGGTFALVTEVHESIAPITIGKGTASAVTIEVIGEAVLRAIATGDPNTSKISFAPPGLIRVTQAGQAPQEFPYPQPGGQVPPIPIIVPPGALPHLLELTIGEGPRAPDQAVPGNSDRDPTAAAPNAPVPAIDTVANNQTIDWGALDLLRVRVLVPAVNQNLVELRVGHMEAEAAVPTGGILCPTPPEPPTPPAPPLTLTVTADPFTAATTTTAGNGNGNGTTTTTAPGNSGGNGTTTTTAGNGNGNGNGTTTTTALGVTPGAGTSPPTTAQVQAVTFSQTPTASAQTQTPNFTG